MAIIEMVKRKNLHLIGTKRAIDYILREDKTRPELIGAKDCHPKSAYEQFVLNKEYFGKTTGRQHKHIVQSYDGKVNSEIVKKIADEFVTHEHFRDFQMVYAVHVDTDNTHVHYILDTVSIVDGRKYQQSEEDLENIKKFSDELSMKYHLPIVHKKEAKEQKPHQSSGEYYGKKYKRSEKYQTTFDVKKALFTSKNKEQFVHNMNQLGYEVTWSSSRKYITFTTSNGRKFRANKLDHKFSKEYFEKAFVDNQISGDIWECMIKSKSKEEFINKLEEAGYTVHWDDSDEKITFINIDGINYSNEKYSKEYFEKAFVDNQISGDIWECMIKSKSKEEFIGKLAETGYTVHWNDENEDITFTNSDGINYSNEKYSKEYFEKAFVDNQISGDIWECMIKSKSKEEFIGKLAETGYTVHWNDENEDITFTNSDGINYSNEKYSKEYFEKAFVNNQISGDIWECMIKSKSKEEFIGKLAETGYTVHWNDSDEKITFTNSDGINYSNEKYSKEYFEKAFEENQRSYEQYIAEIQKGFLLEKLSINLASTLLDLILSEANHHNKNPHSSMDVKGELLKEKIAEDKKGKGLDFER